MRLEVKPVDTHSAIIVLHAEKLNAENAVELKNELSDQFNKSVNHVILDLTSVKYCDSSGLSAILHGNRMCKDSNGSFKLCGLQPMVLKMINISRLDSILNIFENQSEALETV